MVARLQTGTIQFSDGTSQTSAAKSTTTSYNLAGVANITHPFPIWTKKIEVWFTRCHFQHNNTSLYVQFHGPAITYGPPHYNCGGNNYMGASITYGLIRTTSHVIDWGFAIKDYYGFVDNTGVIDLTKIVDNGTDVKWYATGTTTSMTARGSGNLSGHCWVPNGVNAIKVGTSNSLPAHYGEIHIVCKSV